MEDQVDIPLNRKFESYSYWGNDLVDSEWSMSSGCEFSCAVWEW
jgi:hypothetical protein